MSRKTGFTLDEVTKWETALSEFRNSQLLELTVALSNKYHQGNTAHRLAKRTLKVLDELRWELENMRLVLRKVDTLDVHSAPWPNVVEKEQKEQQTRGKRLWSF